MAHQVLGGIVSLVEEDDGNISIEEVPTPNLQIFRDLVQTVSLLMQRIMIDIQQVLVQQDGALRGMK